MSRPESIIQSAIVEYLKLKRVFCFSIPNGVMLGGKNRFAMLAMLKNEGFMFGASDLVLVMPEEVIFVEVKTKIGKQSENQETFQLAVERMGYKYLIWRSLDDCRLFFKARKNTP